MIQSNFVLGNLGVVEGSTIYRQWQNVSEQIQGFLLSHPNLNTEIRIQLLAFNAQYLLKVADYSKSEALLNGRDISPIFKKDLSYHRDYGEDNRLLLDCIGPLKNIWPNADILFASNNSFMYFLKNTRKIAVLDSQDCNERIQEKVNKVLSYYDTTPAEQWKSRLYIHINGSWLGSPDQILSILKVVNEAIKRYPFKDFRCAIALAKTASYGVFYRWSNLKGILAVNDREPYKIALRRGGSTPSIQQSGEFFGRLLNDPKGFYDAIIKNSSLTLQPSIESLSDHSSAFDQLKTGPFWVFKNLDKSQGLPVVQIVGSAVIGLVEGLLELRVDKTFRDGEIEDLLQASIQRVNHFFQRMIEQKGDARKFGNLADLVIEEVILLLRLSRPYQNGDLEQIVCSHLISSWPKPSLVRFTQSGTQCLVEVLRTITKMHKKSGQTTSIMYFDDIYFENSDFIAHLPKPAETYEIKGESSDSFLKQVDALQKANKKVNTLFVDIHSSAKKGRKIQSFHDIVEIIDLMLSKGVVESCLTVCIDYTIGSWGTLEIKQILEHYQELIQAGQLHFYIYRSVHKLDILGSDKIMAGSYLVYSNPETLFYKSMLNNEPSVTAEDVDYQALAHFYTFASQQIQAYYETIISNAQYLYGQINPRLIANPNNQLWVTQRQDQASTYIEIGFSDSELGQRVGGLVIDTEEIQTRDSFGYREISWLGFGTIVDNNGLVGYTGRITPGIEDKAQIVKLAGFINNILESNAS